MTSFETTLTLMMAFNAIVFNGVTADEDEKWEEFFKQFPEQLHPSAQTPGCTEFDLLKTCVINRWRQSVGINFENKTCCLSEEAFCSVTQMSGSDVCEAMLKVLLTNDIVSTVRTSVEKTCSNITGNRQKYCKRLSLKTNPIPDNCKDVKKFMNCFSTSSHLMSRPLLVFTPIVTLFVIYFFN